MGRLPGNTCSTLTPGCAPGCSTAELRILVVTTASFAWLVYLSAVSHKDLVPLAEQREVKPTPPPSSSLLLPPPLPVPTPLSSCFQLSHWPPSSFLSLSLLPYFACFAQHRVVNIY